MATAGLPPVGRSWLSGWRLTSGIVHVDRVWLSEAPGAVYSGSLVDCQATICHCPPLLTYTSVNRTPKLLGFPLDMT